MNPFTHKQALHIFLWIGLSHTSGAWGLSSPELLVTVAVNIDDPMQIESQISSIKMLSLHNTFPDLPLIGSKPLDGFSTGRIWIPDSEIISSLSPTYFSQKAMVSEIHADGAKIP